MKKHDSKCPITGIAEATAERVRLGGELLQTMAHAVAANEKAQRRFRTAVLIRLARIDTIVTQILGGQVVESQQWKPVVEDKVRDLAKDTEERVSQLSQELGLKMVRYVYEESDEPVVPRDRRRKWSDWEI